MGCRIIGSRVERRCKRPSNQSPTASSQRFMASFPTSSLFQGVLQGRIVRRPDLELEGLAGALHAIDATEEAARRRTGGAFTVGVIDAAVTGAHEQPRLREPPD